MTQPSTPDSHIADTERRASDRKMAEGNPAQPAIVHPNFDPTQTPLDPARPLSDIPEPARRLDHQLRKIYGKSTQFYQSNKDDLSKWGVIATEALAEHLSLLQAAKLADFPEHFYHNHSEQPLLASLRDMTLLDMADIQQALRAHPKLHRYGFGRDDELSAGQRASAKAVNNQSVSLRAVTKRYNPDELLSSLYADDWQVILQPQQFETGEGSLATDIMACSVAVHALQQCSTRKSINTSYSAAQICQHVRSYLLSQSILEPAQSHAYRQIRVFVGHIIVAACHLGWEIQVSQDGQCYFNLSSRNGLFSRYPNMQDYDINGWSS